MDIRSKLAQQALQKRTAGKGRDNWLHMWFFKSNLISPDGGSPASDAAALAAEAAHWQKLNHLYGQLIEVD